LPRAQYKELPSAAKAVSGERDGAAVFAPYMRHDCRIAEEPAPANWHLNYFMLC
jgi:hypothetical protein